ncbi:MAG: phosphoribosylaminoimidazolesuccinocarboxamide synthase [Flavobacterium sp. BFFFF1]|uniref:phosphoribosylaminoimidazolesuccinocarboxamide synthase n=1 Tax=Flavobacterium sp. BFFFF1 TaxID=2015557 RepID=UPI000BC7787B|nr:phosphoribosylaminoimidazolesuccinocarboxamide synthase [Flavobacterium sp. BFFFF1]OYU80702.1 MAG: phosphoribosylaminoimidazolesuccinocarboxamide synthase [Flavobacterium sp. BFFFF1]
MHNESKFKTKTGYCHILPDKIILTRSGTVGEVSKIVVGNGISRMLIIYGVIALSSLYFAFTSFKSGENGFALLYLFIVSYIVYGITKSVNNSATPIIMRDKIKGVTFHSAKPGRTRAYFEIGFEDENGKLKNRLIMLPGSMNDGKNETEKALFIMEHADLIKPIRNTSRS